ncbi:MAG: flagellar biosynthesis protein FliQ [Treponema sp.]|nr:flagellar biosynthesis protein FliQ [Treponema sp.]MBR7080431.1 flagellar biosynthesis protein FliQ [Treponema sp.]
MSIGDIAVLMRDGIWHVFLLCAPVLGAAIIIGLIVAIFQATTSIQEQTLTFLPKLFIILLMLALLGGWLFSTMQTFTINLFESIPRMG